MCEAVGGPRDDPLGDQSLGDSTLLLLNLIGVVPSVGQGRLRSYILSPFLFTRTTFVLVTVSR